MTAPALIDAAERIAPWIYGQLLDEPTLITPIGGRIYRDDAPQGAVRPHLVYLLQSDTDRTTANGRHLLGTMFWLVKIIGEGDRSPAFTSIIDGVLKALHGQGPLTFRGVRIGRCTREEVLPQGPDYVGSTRIIYSNHSFSIVGYPLP